jgi:3-phosphoshikimate 1-carboxyvinyltransferase
MKRLRILPLSHPVKAEITVPGSKSYTNRALFLGALTPGKVHITNPLLSDDTKAMMACLETLGIRITQKAASIEITGDSTAVSDKDYELDAGLSGITLRFMLALCAIIPGRQILRGQPGLHKRPVGDMVKSLQQLGADIEYLGKSGYPPLRVQSSALSGGTVKLNGAESSQYLSALLMVAPLVNNLTIAVTGELISKPYIDMTIDAMKHFGVAVTSTDYRHYQVSGQYRATSYVVEGDISSASYFFAIAALTRSTITVKGVDPQSRQADMKFLKILEQMGSKVTSGTHEITVAGKGVKPLRVNMQDCPDQAPTLAVLAAFATGKTTISGIRSLRVKETERIKALEQELHKMGIKAVSTPDTLTIHGGKPQPASIATYGDHRMAMSFAVAGAKLAGVEIENSDVVDKTFPDFWKKLAAVGVKTEVGQPNIVLIGMRGSGKTTIARQLAQELGVEHLDLDEIMANRLALSTPEIVKKHGWGYFRDQESTIAKEVSVTDNKLISTGGGVVLKPQNVTALKKNGVIIFLRASVDVMVRRLGDISGRPPLTNAKSLRAEVTQVLRERQSLYEAAADIIIDTDTLTPVQIAKQITKRLEERS